MEESKSILHELYVYSEWKPEPEYLQKPDNILPENISAFWRWLKFFGPKKSLIDSVTAFKERQQKWHIALGDEGKVIAVLTDNILEIRTKRSEYATIAARTTVNRDTYAQWRKLVWSPDCSFVVLAYGNGVISFFDLTASNLFNIPTDCTRPGGLECTDNTHAVASIIFMPLRVKDKKWNWEVLVVTYDGKLRGYLVSQDGYKLHHSFRLLAAGGVAAAEYCRPHDALLVCGVPHAYSKDPSSPLTAGITSWRILNEEPWYKLSVVSDELDSLVADRFHLYVPFLSNKNLTFVVNMVLSPDGNKLVCLHCNGDISIWRLPLLKLLHRWPLYNQPQHDLDNPLVKDKLVKGKDVTKYYGADVNWWGDEEIILSRFSGAVTVNDIQTMVNILGKKPEFFQGSPQVTCAYDGTFLTLECESNVLPAKRSRSDDSMEVVQVQPADTEDSMLELTKELIKSMLYAITDIETFQPKPKKITVVSRIYRLLGVKSTTPQELFSRKIESGNYSEALTLAETFNLDSDLVYQQQWRKNPVSTDAIQKYLCKVSKKIWAVHQCVDRLPETLPAAKELLLFGLQLTNEEILNEINKDKLEHEMKDPDDITLEDLNAYTSELLRCRHVMLFYKQRLRLYEAILKCEKSTYRKDEYDRLRSHSIVHSSMEIAKEGRVEALTCLWPNIQTVAMQLAVLEKLPETLNPLEYQHLLPTRERMGWFDKESPIKMKPIENDNDWCRKEIFRSIWSSTWSEDTTPETEQIANLPANDDITVWYEKRAREIEERCGLVSHAVTLVTIATVGGRVEGLDNIMFHLLTLDTLLYDVNVEGVTLKEIEVMSELEVCGLLMKMSTPTTFVTDLKKFVIPFLKRYETLSKRVDACLNGLTDYLESISVEDLSYILLVLQSPSEFKLDVRTHLELAERCLFAHTGTDQLDMACDLLDTILQESDGSISGSELVRRVKEIERLVSASSKLSWRGVKVPPRELREILYKDAKHSHNLLTRVARTLSTGEAKPTQQDWEKLLKDLVELQTTLFTSVTKEQCYEIYASSLLTSGDASSIKLSSEVLTCEAESRRGSHLVSYARSVDLVSNAAKEYFNSASSLTDPALELARCCLTLIKDGNPEIQQELDLISALSILSSFDLNILPIQVRLCEDRMTLIEDCLKSNPSAYMASHKLLKLAKLLRVAGDDEQTREGQVLQQVGERALQCGPGGCGCAAAAARRLAALRYPPAATLLAHVAQHAHAHADRATRRELYAAALVHCGGECLESILRARLGLELEGLQQMGAAIKEHSHLAERWPSTDDEFADAITTPVIEKKDLVAPPKTEKTGVPLFNYLLDTIQNKLTGSEKSSTTESTDKSVHCQEFYGSLYKEHNISDAHYRYDTFSIPNADDTQSRRGQAVLKWFYIQNSIDNGGSGDLEAEVVRKCAEEIIYKDTPLGVSCLLRSTQDFNQTKRLINSHNTDTVICAALYATLMKCNAPELRDNVYLCAPSKMAKTTLKQKNASEEQLQIIRQCIDKLTGMGEVDKLKEHGFNVNGLLFNADEDYRREMIYRIARSPYREDLQLACSLAMKYDLDPLEVWLHRADVDITLTDLTADTLPVLEPDTHTRIKESLWPLIQGDNHNALINFFSLLKSIDEKQVLFGLTAAEHIKLLKKAKAASPDLDYKLLFSTPTVQVFSEHILEIIKPENVGLLTKFLRSLPPVCKVPVSINNIYTMWLTKYFFSVPQGAASSKKWMQQYRQCASYFNKLTKDDLMKFVANTCFSEDALQCVPAGTRNLMITQAVDYCQQEQENDFKFNKNEQTWGQVGQELARWARFLENFHSTTIQGIIENTNISKDQFWPQIEMSHGDQEKIIDGLASLVMEGDLKSSALTTLLQCLHVSATPLDVFKHALSTGTYCSRDLETLINRILQYHKDGVRFPDDYLDKVMFKASELRLPPHKQIAILSLSQRTTVQDSGDMRKIAQFSMDLFKSEWPELDFAEVTEDKLISLEGRREVFNKLVNQCDTWGRKKAFVDVLVCWPWTTGRQDESRSIQCEYLHSLLSSDDQKESLVLIKLLLRRPVLGEEEIKFLMENVTGDAVVNAIWIILLNKSEQTKDNVLKLIQQHKETIENQELDDDFIKELLDNGMLLKLVSTPVYPSIITYLMAQDASSATGEPAPQYTMKWAADTLIKAKYLAEGGHLRLVAMGIPTALRGYTQAVIYGYM